MASRESSKAPEAMDGLLRQTLRQAEPPLGSSGACPSPEILAAYCERSLNDGEIAQCELHLSRCASCREQQVAMARADAASPATEGEKPRWAWLWDWRWLAPATAVLALAAIWHARRPEMTAQDNAQRYVAMSRPAEQPEALAPPLSENKPSPGSPSRDVALVAPQQSAPPPKTAAVRKEKEAGAPAEREAANGLASNLETDALKKDLNAPQRDAAGGAAAGALSSATPAPAPATASASAPILPSATAAQAEVAAEASSTPPAAAKTKQLATPALAGRYSNLAAADQRSAATLLRTPNPQVLWRIGAAGLVERSTDGGATWLGQVPRPGAQLVAGSAPEEKTCWLVGRGGLILLTTNATEWKVIPPPVEADFAGVEAKNSREAAVTAADGRKFTTTDGGENWTPAP